MSDSSTANLFATSGFPYFEQSIDFRQPPYYPYFPNFNPSNAKNVEKSNPQVIGTYINHENISFHEKLDPNVIISSPPKPDVTTVTNLSTPEEPSKKINTVQIIQDGSYDPFNGHLPLL